MLIYIAVYKSLWQWQAEKLLNKLYKPVQDWFAQHGKKYPWSISSVKLKHSNNKLNGIRSHAIIDSRPYSQSVVIDDFRDENVHMLPSSYAVWVSEVMLQQTRVETVIPYYNAWLQRWPSLSQLATSAEEQVLKQWEGLGYYNRALNMRKCAQKCVNEQGRTELPISSIELRKLPGIGEYIAAAIASISSNEAVLALDTNVKRIFSRLYQEQPSSATIKAWQRQHQQALQLCLWCGNANVALIQLGQQLCKASKPLCVVCPLQPICPAATQTGKGNWDVFPSPKTYQKHKCSSQRLLLCAEGKYLLLRKRSGHLCHLWRLPEAQQLGLSDSKLFHHTYLGCFHHAYLQTQEQIKVWAYNTISFCYEWEVILNQQAHQFEWLWTEDFSALTLAGPYRKFLARTAIQTRLVR